MLHRFPKLLNSVVWQFNLKGVVWLRYRRTAGAFSFLFAIALSVNLMTVGWDSSNPLPSILGKPAIAQQPFVVRIGHQKFDPLILVKAKGNLEARLKPLGVTRIEWKEFPSGPPMLEALNAGSIDFARTGDAPPVIAQAAGVPLVYVGGSAPKDQSSAVLVKRDSPIKTITDLRGKKIAFAKSSSAHYLIVKVLESGGLTWNDIQPVYLSPADARAAFEQGSVDAWAIWDPFFALAQAQANARIVRNSSGLVANRDFYLSTPTFANQNPKVIEQIRAETQSVAAWASKNPDQVVDLLSPILKIDKPVLEVVTKRRNYGFESVSPRMVAEQQAIADAFYRLKLIPKSITVADAIWKPSLRAAKS